MNINSIKKDFPIFRSHPHLIYLDTAASALTPQPVIAKMREYYEHYPVNIARGLYSISEEATNKYEKSRKIVAEFINAKSDEIIFTSGTTHGLNMLSNGLDITTEKSNIVVTASDHHANFIPWQQYAKNTNSSFRIINITNDGKLDIDDIEKKVDKNTILFAMPYISNVLGTINPIKEIIKIVKKINPSVITIIDAAQAASHININVRDIDCDFLVFSGHKLYGPTGIGVLYGKKNKLEKLKPLLFGGEMVSTVTCNQITLKELPHRLEAGTPAIAEAIGLGAAIKYLINIGQDKIAQHDKKLMSYAIKKITHTFGNKVIIHGSKNPSDRCGLISFSLKNIHPHDIAHLLDTDYNIAIRAGFHCAQPIHNHLNIGATARISFGIYTTKKDIDIFIEGLKNINKLLST